MNHLEVTAGTDMEQYSHLQNDPLPALDGRPIKEPDTIPPVLAAFLDSETAPVQPVRVGFGEYPENEIKIGNWYTFCCQKDLQIIESEDDIELIKEWIADGVDVGVYESQRQALLDIREAWVRSKQLYGKLNPENYEQEIKECDEMIRKTEESNALAKKP